MSQLPAYIFATAMLCQLIAAGTALRLNFAYGFRWAWSLMSGAIALMTIHRGFRLYQFLSQSTGNEPLVEYTLDETDAWLTLLVSFLMMAGVARIGVVFRDAATAESLLRGQRDQLRGIVAENEFEFKMARHVQEGLLPSGPLDRAGLSIASSWHPVRESGGDYCDYFPLQDGRIVALMADVSGHGLGPSLIAMVVRTHLRAVIQQSLSHPGDVLRQLNQFVIDDAEGHFVTIFLAVIDPEAKTFVYASAGHPAWLIHGKDEVVQLETLSMPLGVDASAPFDSSGTFQLRADSMLFLATDGMFEATSPQREAFGVERALKCLLEHRHETATQIAESLYPSVLEFSNNELHDDITALIVKRGVG